MPTSSSPFPHNDRSAPPNKERPRALDTPTKDRLPESTAKAAPKAASTIPTNAKEGQAPVPSSKKIAQQPTVISPRLPQPTAQVSESSAETTAAKLLTIPLANELGPDVVQTLTSTLGDIFDRLIVEATDVTGLKTLQSAAKKKVEKRRIEFEKSKPHHEKFPATRETQTLAKEYAEKEYNTISEKRREKETSLKSLTTQAAKTVIPTILATSKGGADKSELQRVEKNCQDLVEKTRNEFTKLVEDQRNLLIELQNRNKELEEKHLALEKRNQELHDQGRTETKTIREQLDKEIRPQVKDTLEKLGISARGVQKLEQDMLELKGSAAKISNDVAQIPPNLKEQISKVDTFSGLLGELRSRPQVPVNLQEQLQKIVTLFDDVNTLKSRVDTRDTWAASAQTSENADKQYSTLNSKIENVEKFVQSSIETLLGDQQIFRENWTRMDRRVKVTEGRPDPTGFESRLAKMENAQKTTATSAGLDGLQKRVGILERSIDPISTTCKRVDDYEKSGSFQVKPSDLEELRASLKAVEAKVNLPQNTADRSAEIANLEKRLKDYIVGLTLTQSSGPDPSGGDSSNSINNAALEHLRQRLEELDSTQTEEFRKLRQEIEDTDDLVGATINEKVEKSLELAASAMNTGLSTLKTPATLDEKSADKVISFLGDAIVEKVETSLKREMLAVNTRLSTLEDPATLDSLVEQSASKAISLLRPQLPPVDLLPRVAADIEKISQDMAASIKQQNSNIGNVHNTSEATRHALGILTHRVDNINTGALAKHMVDQLAELYPHVQHTEILMSNFKASLEQMEGRLATSDKSLGELKELAEMLRAQTQLPAADPGPSIRSEVDKQEKETLSLKSEVKKLKNAIEKVQEEAKNNAETQEQEYLKFREDMLKQITDVIYKDFLDSIEKIETKIKELQESSPRQQASSRNAVSPAVSHSSRTGTAPNGVLSSRVRPTSSATNRQPSFASDTNNKKRKLQNGQAARTNGTAPKKRRRRGSFEDPDDEEGDPDFIGDDIPQPGVSDDEE
jgi:DNA repair exonuclease SbcCD ATPase subunit